MLRVGDEIGREDGRRYRLCGVDGSGQWVGQPLDHHGPPEVLTAETLREGFGVADAAVPTLDEAAALRERDARATAEATAAWGRAHGPQEAHGTDGPAPPPGSPEAVFLALQEGDDDDA